MMNTCLCEHVFDDVHDVFNPFVSMCLMIIYMMSRTGLNGLINLYLSSSNWSVAHRC
jgi:hypothetical protein